MLKSPVLFGVCCILLGLTWGAKANDQEVVNDPWELKLTPSYYSTTNSADAYDVNLRANRGVHAVWLGYYRRGGEFEQTRTGYEYALALPFGQLVPSLQLASRGFAGGSINTQISGPYYLLAGYGRTNTRDYYNLNFDPNDSFVYGVGTSQLPQSNLSLFTVKDNRLHTDQIVTHLLWKFAESGNRRWTVDLSNKHGRSTPEDDPVSGNALSVTYDFHDMFVRLARDRKVNCTREDMTRWSFGLRF